MQLLKKWDSKDNDMAMKHIDQRIALLIDVQNLYHSGKNLYGAHVNFKEILKMAVSKRKLIRAFAYVVRTKTGEENGSLSKYLISCFTVNNCKRVWQKNNYRRREL